jgi:hypothetical protein
VTVVVIGPVVAVGFPNDGLKEVKPPIGVDIGALITFPCCVKDGIVEGPPETMIVGLVAVFPFMLIQAAPFQ